MLDFIEDPFSPESAILKSIVPRLETVEGVLAQADKVRLGAMEWEEEERAARNFRNSKEDRTSMCCETRLDDAPKGPREN